MPFIMGNATLTIDGETYEDEVSAATFTPTSGIVTWKGLTPDAVFTFPQNATWVLDLEYAQDYTTDDTLAVYLLAHEGETVPDVVFTPIVGGRSFTADITIVPGSIGGKVDEVAVGTVSLGSTKPVISALA
jgi:hypothetical protein